MATKHNSLKNLYLSEIKTDIENHPNLLTEIISQEDIENLPIPVQKHFHHCGYLGQVKMTNAKIEFENIQF